MSYCNRCGSTYHTHSCGCAYSHVSICDPCNTNTGCPLQLDTECVIYHKANNEISGLVNLDISNGATLELILDTIDSMFEGFDVSEWSLECLRDTYTINNIQQFAEAVDVELCTLADAITPQTPITPVDSESIDLSVSGTDNHTLEANLIVSAEADNQLSVLADGAYSAPQILSVNYTDKTVAISDGNSVSLAAFATGVDGYLGVFTVTDPTPLDGQYWFRSDTDELKIELNGSTRIITIT